MAQVDIDRLINACPPGSYSAGGWSIRIDGVRRGITAGDTQSLIVWGEATKGARTLSYTQASPLEWREAKGGTTTNEARALFASMLDGL